MQSKHLANSEVRRKCSIGPGEVLKSFSCSLKRVNIVGILDDQVEIMCRPLAHLGRTACMQKMHAGHVRALQDEWYFCQIQMFFLLVQNKLDHCLIIVTYGLSAAGTNIMVDNFATKFTIGCTMPCGFSVSIKEPISLSRWAHCKVIL